MNERTNKVGQIGSVHLLSTMLVIRGPQIQFPGCLPSYDDNGRKENRNAEKERVK